MKIAFFLDNTHLQNIDFSSPEKGNPGTGAGTYLHAAIPYFLNKNHNQNIEAIILAPNTDKLPSNVTSYKTKDIIDAASKSKEIGADFFVFRPRRDEEKGILDHIDKIQMPSIGRAALTPHVKHLRKMAKSKYFKSLVCVGREQYDYLMDCSIAPKLAYIDNGIHIDSCYQDQLNNTEKDNNLVVYMGALVPVKGFHQLAQAWSKVIKKFPNAKLSVIGSVKMYGENEKVGPLGVAHENYEREQIIPYLCDDKGNLHKSVTFHGKLGKEKFDIMQKALVGVANPTGQTETCCVSAVEMSACKTAVVSGAYYALLDTVLHNKTGLLGRGVNDLTNNICACLKNPKMAKKLGEEGYLRAQSKYDFSVVIPLWVQLFKDLNKYEKPTKVKGKIKNITRHYKLLRLINRPIQKTLGRFITWPSILEIQTFVYKILMKIKFLKNKTIK